MRLLGFDIVKYASFNVIFSGIFPPSVLGVLGRLFGALSLFSLLQYAAEFGLSATLYAILDIYMFAVKVTIGLLDPFVIKIIDYFNQLFQLRLKFSEGWQHIFVVLQILFARDAGTAFSDGRPVLALVRLVAGFLIAFVFAVLTFATELNGTLLSNILFCLAPVLGLLLYDIAMYGFSATIFFNQIGVGEFPEGGPRKKFFIHGMQRSAFRFLLVASASISIFLAPGASKLEYPQGGVIGIISGLIINAVYWLILGGLYAAREMVEGQKYKDAFFASEAGRFGLAVAGMIFWFFFFCALNAGTRLLGF
jgi:hypothetical protein